MEEKKPVAFNTSDIQSKLDKKLGPEYISKRIGFGSSRVAYIEGWRVINLANQIFGYNGWSTEVKSVTVDFLDDKQGKYNIGCTAIVRVTLENGTYREDIGYGTVENERRKSAAFERAKKSAVTDALKRALRGFGNALGNCLYDKDFLAKIDKVKFDPPDFDEGNLFRPHDEISESSRSNTIDTDTITTLPNKRRQLVKIGNNNPDIKVENIHLNRGIQNVDKTKPISTVPAVIPPSGYSNMDRTLAESNIHNTENEEMLDDSFMMSDDFQDDDLINIGARPVEILEGELKHSNHNNKPVNTSVTFVTAKGATSLQNNDQISKENMFDPKYQAQSINHTLDQSTSKPVPASKLKENAAPSSREAIYEKFAPKGKQIDNVPTSTENDQTTVETIISNQQENEPVLVKSTVNNIAASENKATTEATGGNFAPPTQVVHPNSFVPASNTSKSTPRRGVGRPKINPMNLRKSNP